MSSRNWVFTINNPSTCEIVRRPAQIKFLVAVLERGESGTPHYQGYVELKTSRNLNQIQAIFENLPAPHFETRKGSRQQAISYVLKTCREELLNSTDYVKCSTSSESLVSTLTQEWMLSGLEPLIVIGFEGTYCDLALLTQEKKSVRERLHSVRNLIRTGNSQKQIADSDFELWCKYRIAFNEYALLCSMPRCTSPRVTVLQGPTGTGKSYWAREQDSQAYWKPRNLWWDGYNEQKTVVIDEFYGWLPFDLLLRLCDENPLQVEIKGGSVNFNSEHIIFTTNKIPSNWYQNVYFEAFIRRVTHWIIKPTRQDIRVYTNYLDIRWAEY